MSKIDKWELLAKARNYAIEKKYERLARALKAEVRYRRLMAKMKNRNCPEDICDYETGKILGCLTTCLDTNKTIKGCWRLFVKRELDGERK